MELSPTLLHVNLTTENAFPYSPTTTPFTSAFPQPTTHHPTCFRFRPEWGVVHGVTEEQGRYDYMNDMAALMQELNIGWTWWVFRGGGGDTWAHGSFEVGRVLMTNVSTQPVPCMILTTPDSIGSSSISTPTDHLRSTRWLWPRSVQ